jgi:hypothetical protein
MDVTIIIKISTQNKLFIYHQSTQYLTTSKINTSLVNFTNYIFWIFFFFHYVLNFLEKYFKKRVKIKDILAYECLCMLMRVYIGYGLAFLSLSITFIFYYFSIHL